LSTFEFISNECKESKYDRQLVLDKYNSFKNTTGSNMTFTSYRKRVNEVFEIVTMHVDKDSVVDQDLFEETVKLAKDKQKLQDLIRINRKINRETFRCVNVLEAYSDGIKVELEKASLAINTKTHEIKDTNEYIAILNIADLHIGETIEQSNNEFNLSIVAKRLQKMVQKTIMFLNAYGITNVLITLNGDIINNDTILDKQLTNAEHKSKCTLQAAHLLEQVIIDLNKVANVTIASVVGNESRIDMFMPNDNRLVTHNYDWTIYNILKILFKDKSGVSFLGGGSVEKVININGNNILMVHGNNLRGGIDKAMKGIISKYALQGIQLRFILTGHIHETYVSSFISRGAGLPGANAYAHNGNMLGRAGLNLSLMSTKGDIDTVAIDLQNCDDYIGYNLVTEWESEQEAEKEKHNAIIMKVLI